MSQYVYQVTKVGFHGNELLNPSIKGKDKIVSQEPLPKASWYKLISEPEKAPKKSKAKS